MRLSRHNWIVRWAYSPFLQGVPRSWGDEVTVVSGCSLFWRIVLLAPCFWSLVLGAGALLGLVAWNNATDIAKALGFLGGCAVLTALAIWLCDENAPRGGHVTKLARAINERWCPRVELTED